MDSNQFQLENESTLMKRITPILWIGFLLVWFSGCGADPKTELPSEPVPLTGEPTEESGALEGAGTLQRSRGGESR